MIGAQEFIEELENEIVEEIIEEESVQLPGYFIYALLGCLVTVVGLLCAVLMLTYKRRQNRKVFNPPASILAHLTPLLGIEPGKRAVSSTQT